MINQSEKRKMINYLKSRDLYGKPSYTQKQIARWFNVSPSYVSKVVKSNNINRKIKRSNLR